MAVPALDALLDTPGPLPIVLQEFQIIISLQQEDVGCLDPLQDQFGSVSQIGQKPDVPLGRSQQKSNRIVGVVRNAERIDRDISNLKAVSGVKEPKIEHD